MLRHLLHRGYRITELKLSYNFMLAIISALSESEMLTLVGHITQISVYDVQIVGPFLEFLRSTLSHNCTHLTFDFAPLVEYSLMNDFI